MKRVLRIAALVLVALLLVVGIAYWWLTSTSAGSRWLLGQVQSRVETLEYERLEGGLSSGLTLEALRFGQEGLEVTAARLELAVDLRFLPLGVTVERLALDDVAVALPAGDAEPSAEPFELGDYTAPIPVEVESLVIDGLTVRTGAEPEPLTVERIALSAGYGESLRIRELEIDMAPYALSAGGRIGLVGPWRSDLQAGLEWRLNETRTQRLDLELRGPIDDLVVELDGNGPLQAEARAEVRGLPDAGALEARLELSGGLSQWPDIAGSVENVRIDASGDAKDWNAEVAGRVRWPGQPDVDVMLVAEGGGEAIEVTRGEFALLDGVVRVTGRAELGTPMTADARVRLEALDFTPLYPDWPAQAAVSGGFDATWNGRVLDIDELALRAPPAPLEVAGGGRFDTSDESLDVTLEWQSLVWPPVTDAGENTPEPLFSSESGEFEASGTLEEWRAEIRAWLQTPGQPRARLELEAAGDARQARIDSGTIRLDEAGSVALTGTVGYGDTPSAALDLVLAELNPGAFVPELPGRIDGRFGLSLDGLDPLTLGVEVRQLAGTLRSQPLDGSGSLQIVRETVERADIVLSLGANRVGLATRDGDDWQVNVDAERLGQLWPGLSGALAVEATFDPSGRMLEWQLESGGMGWSGRRLAELRSGGTAHWGDAPRVDARLEATDVDLNPWERLERFSMTLAGNCKAHTLTTAFSGTRAAMDFELTGHLPGCLQADRGWSGVVRKMTFSDTPLGEWQLDQNLPIQFRDGVVRAGAACLWTPAGTGRLCLNELRAGEDGEAALAFNSVPIDLLLLPADPVFTLGSRLRGVARVGWDSAGARNIDAELRMGPGAVRMLGGEEDLLVIRGARLSLDSPRPHALDAALDLRVERESELVAQASIPDVRDPAAMRVDATANLTLPNLAALNRLVPQLDEMGGRLEGNFSLAGPVQSLDFDGRIAIREGSFFHAPLGSRVEQLELVLDGDETGGRLDGSFSAGDGSAEIDGTLDLDAPGGWQGRLALDGERLELFNVDWLEMTATPNLELAWLPDRLELDGLIAIDRARLGLPPGSETEVGASPDVVVVGREDATSDEGPEAARDIVGSVTLSLSDDVRMSAAGMETNIAGELDLRWPEGALMPDARGSLHLVDGSYSAYGQNLEVTEGDVLFTGNPVSNPVLEIEAVREIFGDAQVERAGVRIQGPAQDPEINLFTSPPTSREKALAYILTGAEFDHAGGQGAFSVGFWVLPRLFVSYGIGIFETGNVLAARYELSDKWGLRATSGERDTGVDLSFIIDR